MIFIALILTFACVYAWAVIHIEERALMREIKECQQARKEFNRCLSKSG